jgi:hypothetical protein
VHHWAQGGETKASNLVSLCRFHHRKVHEGAVVVQVLDDGAFRFVRPDGRAFDSPVPGRTSSFDWTRLEDQHREADIHIDADTAVTRWRGERIDYGLAIEVLLTQAHRTTNVPAGTRT